MAKTFNQRGLTFKQVALTLLVTLLVGVVVTIIQSVVSLDGEQHAARERMRLLMESAQANAAAAAFRLDNDLAGYVTNGLATSFVIAEATILDENGQVLAHQRSAANATEGAPQWIIELAYGELGPAEIPLYSVREPGLRVGTLYATPDRRALAAAFLTSLQQTIILDTAKAVLLALVLSIIFYFALTRPLLRLANSVRSVEPGRQTKLHEVDSLRAGDDEFANLVTSFDEQLALFERLLEERGNLLDQLRLRDGALASMDSGVLIIDTDTPDFPIVDANAAIESMMGVGRNTLIGRNFMDFIERGKRSPEGFRRLEAFANTGMSGGAIADVFPFFSPGDVELWCKISIVPVPSEEGQSTHRVVIINDITGTRETEEQLRHSQKMDALGKVAGGIAHDFNNMLAIMKGNLELAQIDHAQNTELLARLGPIEHSVDRASELTRRLLRFSRKAPIKQSDVDLHDLTLNIKELLQSSLTPEIHIEMELEASSALVRVDPGDFEDALLNLAVNARDAMPRGGTLRLTTADCVLDESSVELRDSMKPGSYLRLTVTDTGEGMDEAILERIFEPFFTTKEESQGTGLGLSQVYGFVDRSGGNIQARSVPGEGTRFDVVLPLVTAATQQPGVEGKARDYPRGSETVLIVDDEPELLRIAKELLESLGYKTLVTAEPGEAIRLFGEHESGIDLLLSDIVMPGINGYELAEALRERRPRLPVLLVSGFDSHGESAATEFETMAKPYTLSTLALSVRRALDHANAP